MSKATLVIMAAGIGSRFGGGIKQLAPIGPNGEIIMDYKQGLTKLYSLSAKISRKISKRSLATVLKKK